MSLCIPSIDYAVSGARKKNFLILRQAEAENTSRMCCDSCDSSVRIEAEHLGGELVPVCIDFASCHNTKISPPSVPANILSDDTRRANIDLSCRMRCSKTGWKLSSREASGDMCVVTMLPFSPSASSSAPGPVSLGGRRAKYAMKESRVVSDGGKLTFAT